MERRAISIMGTVQGVGFRPFVFALASRLKLNGLVRNESGAVHIEVEGEPASLDEFLIILRTQPPPLARIHAIAWELQKPRGDARFRIERSQATTGPVVICPDVATCDDCLAELFDPDDRRYGYPFLNCTNCGPRLTIVQAAPYDRCRTTMAGFPMCPACAAEYEDPSDRRFHAQPTACRDCGPNLSILKENGERMMSADPLAMFVEAILAGRIGAMKGLGGYHLVCDARRPEIVAELRRRKHRDEKPFAIMVRTADTAEAICNLSEAERRLLESPRRPIVLLRKCAACQNTYVGTPGIAEEVAPGNPYLGVMLPYTPLHHLLLAAVGNVPLVMTSGNRCDEPIAYLDDDAVERLSGIADVFLVHNRPIHVRSDDSVTRVIDGHESPVRRSRGYAPEPITLPISCPEPILAVGGQLKATFALGRDGQAFLSQHMGDLDHFEAYRAFERDIRLFEDLFAVRPAWIVHDLHPDYSSTRYALSRQAKEGMKSLAVQHHYAHMASCMAENGLNEPVIGVSLDGTGYGTDGAIWGGEFLVGDYRGFHRAGHLRYVGMPGGEQAIHEPWRMALAHLVDAGHEPSLLQPRISAAVIRTVRQLLERRFNAPWTSSAGRLFDAVAALAGVRYRVSYEGQAAIQLEWLATDMPPDSAYPFEIESEAGGEGGNVRRWESGKVRKWESGNVRKCEGETGECENEKAATCESASAGTYEMPSSLSHIHTFSLSDVRYVPPVSPSQMRPSLPSHVRTFSPSHFVIDTRPLIHAVAADAAQGVAPAVIARRFHTTVVEMISAACALIRRDTGLDAVTLSGGVFMNALLTTEVSARLSNEGFRVYRHRLVPPNDGGLSLGQVAVAACRIAAEKGDASCA